MFSSFYVFLLLVLVVALVAGATCAHVSAAAPVSPLPLDAARKMALQNELQIKSNCSAFSSGALHCGVASLLSSFIYLLLHFTDALI